MNLIIRKMIEDDYKPLCRLLSDEKVMEFFESTLDAKETLKFLNEAGLSVNHKVYAVTDDDEFIGYVIYNPYDK